MARPCVAQIKPHSETTSSESSKGWALWVAPMTSWIARALGYRWAWRAPPVKAPPNPPLPVFRFAGEIGRLVKGGALDNAVAQILEVGVG